MSGRSVRLLLAPCLAVALWPASGMAPGPQSTDRVSEANSPLTPRTIANRQAHSVASYYRPASVGSQVHFEVVPPPPA